MRSDFELTMKVSATDAEFLNAQTERLAAMGRVLGGEVTAVFGKGNEEAFLRAANNAALVTFREFRELMERRNHSVDELVDMFRGKIEDPREFFERVMSCRVKIGGRYEDRSDCVIPYRSVLEFYRQELHFFKDAAKKTQRLCQCGCGKPVFGQYKFASDTCRKRLQRHRPIVPVEERGLGLPIIGS